MIEEKSSRNDVNISYMLESLDFLHGSNMSIAGLKNLEIKFLNEFGSMSIYIFISMEGYSFLLIFFLLHVALGVLSVLPRMLSVV